MDARHLLSVWPRLRRLLGPRYRNPWEQRFPELVRAAQEAEPALSEELRRVREAIRAGALVLAWYDDLSLRLTEDSHLGLWPPEEQRSVYPDT